MPRAVCSLNASLPTRCFDPESWQLEKTDHNMLPCLGSLPESRSYEDSYDLRQKMHRGASSPLEFQSLDMKQS